jgi:hypothetical protein
MFSIKREFIHWDDSLVEVIKKYSTERIKDVNGLKELLDCNVVLRKNETTYFCRKIDEVEIIEETLLPEEIAKESEN